jgi:hypothetical protein
MIFERKNVAFIGETAEFLMPNETTHISLNVTLELAVIVLYGTAGPHMRCVPTLPIRCHRLQHVPVGCEPMDEHGRPAA